VGIGVGAGGGWLVGRLFGWLTYRTSADTRLSQTGDGLIAIAATFLSYGLTEVANAYGFLAVFITALTLRHTHRHHDFNVEMHDFTEQIERVGMMVLLILFGGALVGGLLVALRWQDVIAAAAIILIVRPLAGLIGLWGCRAPLGEKLTLAFFGIRGVGSFYYLAYALNHAEFAQADRLWAIVGLVALFSILLHGLTVTPVMRRLDRSQGRDPDALADAQPASRAEPPNN
jgi:NhaP-type Na+/H+ or K+/H+ antiporter